MWRGDGVSDGRNVRRRLRISPKNERKEEERWSVRREDGLRYIGIGERAAAKEGTAGGEAKTGG